MMLGPLHREEGSSILPLPLLLSGSSHPPQPSCIVSCQEVGPAFCLTPPSSCGQRAERRLSSQQVHFCIREKIILTCML